MLVGRDIAVVTTGRADYGLFVPVLRAAAGRDDLDLSLWITGEHVGPGAGCRDDAGVGSIDRTPERGEAARVHGTQPIRGEAGRVHGTRRFEADGWAVARCVPMASGDGPGAMGAAIAEGVNGFTGAMLAGEPDAVLLLGDRFETLAAAVAAAACGVPIVHLHGGEVTAGAVDNQFRYAISALASYHLVATEKARRRLIAMGEGVSRVIRTGAPGLDHLAGFEPMPRADFNAATGMTGDGAFLLVTLHPTTLDAANPAEQARSLVAALDEVGLPCLVTAANRDPGGEAINSVLREAARVRGWVFAEALGPGVYHAAMAHASAMVGNSSSGIIEAATLGLPVVNIGDRQAGRERSGNVIDCGHGAVEVAGAIGRALAMGRRAYENVYGDGRAGVRIVEALAGVPLGVEVLRKMFEPGGVAEG